eukprot:11292877-Karenia_brevis.AAC.1
MLNRPAFYTAAESLSTCDFEEVRPDYEGFRQPPIKSLEEYSQILSNVENEKVFIHCVDLYCCYNSQHMLLRKLCMQYEMVCHKAISGPQEANLDART